MEGLSDATVVAFIAFCRIAGCFLVLPTFSTARVPAQVRLLLVLSLTVALMPHVWDGIADRVSQADPAMLLRLIVSETIIGAFIGLVARLYVLALSFMATSISMSIGFGGLLGPGVEEADPQAALGSLLSMSAVLILFTLDFHHQVIRALVGSYAVVPVTGSFDVEPMLTNVVDTLTDSFLLVLRLGSPFLAYALIVNLMVGLLNKLTPMIPIYFVSLPFIIAGGLVLMYFALPSFLSLFGQGFFDLSIYR